MSACMATDGTPSAVRGDSTPAQDPAAAASVRPVALPAIPRMRPAASRRGTETAEAPVQTDGAATNAAQQPDENVAEATPSADRNDRLNEVTMHGGAADAAGDASQPPSDRVPLQAPGPPVVDTAPALFSADDESFGISGTMSDPGSEPDLKRAPLPRTDVDGGGDDTGTDPEIDLAAVSLPELDRGIDVESLFDGDVVRYCGAMWQMGEYIGAARRRGEPFKRAIGDAVQRIADEKNLPLDNRLAFSGQVYGRLVYRLEDSHAALTLGTYVHFACLTVRGDKKIVPADPNAERMLNSGLALCESTAFTRDELNDCIFRELTPIVDRRNS